MLDRENRLQIVNPAVAVINCLRDQWNNQYDTLAQPDHQILIGLTTRFCSTEMKP
jgi:hypothetical protein